MRLLHRNLAGYQQREQTAHDSAGWTAPLEVFLLQGNHLEDLETCTCE